MQLNKISLLDHSDTKQLNCLISCYRLRVANLEEEIQTLTLKYEDLLNSINHALTMHIKVFQEK